MPLPSTFEMRLLPRVDTFVCGQINLCKSIDGAKCNQLLQIQWVLLLLLRSSAICLLFTILGEIFAYVTVFNPTNEVVTFSLCGRCMLGMFLLLAFTRVGHECQDLLSLCN